MLITARTERVYVPGYGYVPGTQQFLWVITRKYNNVFGSGVQMLQLQHVHQLTCKLCLYFIYIIVWFQKISVPPYGRFYDLNLPSLLEFQFSSILFIKKIWLFRPPPLKISKYLPWGGYGYFL